MSCDPYRLTSQAPQFLWSMTVRSEDYGYRLAWRHAHLGGLLCDCPEEVYDHLTFEEMADVISCLAEGIWARSMDERPL